MRSSRLPSGQTGCPTDNLLAGARAKTGLTAVATFSGKYRNSQFTLQGGSCSTAVPTAAPTPVPTPAPTPSPTPNPQLLNVQNFYAPGLSPFVYPSSCDSVGELKLCGGGGGRFANLPWSDTRGGRGACISLFAGGTDVLDKLLQRPGLQVLVAGGGRGSSCGGGAGGTGGGGATALLDADGTPIIVAGGGGGTSSGRKVGCNAVTMNAGNMRLQDLVQGAGTPSSDCSISQADGVFVGGAGTASDATAQDGQDGRGYPNFSGGDLTDDTCSGSASDGGFGGGGSGGGTRSGFGGGGGGAGFPGGKGGLLNCKFRFFFFFFCFFLFMFC